MSEEFDKSVFDGSWQDYQMSCNGFYCGMNTPNALSGNRTFSLPPYAKRKPFLVDEYPACPENWMRSKGRSKSYFVAVEEGKGMWLDFNDNEHNTHHVAIVVSIQGINPVTGLPCEDAALEQYLDKCPKHDIEFGPDRYCEKCGYKWPKQNYICTTGTPSGSLWLDGFRAADGVVRQYIMTAEKLKSVAGNVLGKDSEKRVFAVGVSFFLSIDKKKPNITREVRIGSSGGLFDTFYKSATPTPDMIMGDWDYPNDQDYQTYYTCDSGGDHMLLGDSLDMEVKSSSVDVSDQTTSVDNLPRATSKSTAKRFGKGAKRKSVRRTKTYKSGYYKDGEVITEQQLSPPLRQVRQVDAQKLEVGAGAKINQRVYDDPEKLDFWRDEPEAIICVNYVAEKDAIAIIEQGKEEIENNPEGFLQDMPVGN